ncbi:MAG: molybdopterin-dependent oxidoreductase [Oligoflexia bacterium]|nr:molybdopterin-dependent oxidoreductase [Oligoflexia bacterium]
MSNATDRLKPGTRLEPATSAGGPILGDDRAAALAVLGLGQIHPHPLAVAFRAAWQGRRDLGATWTLLRRGVCDGCSLGPRGLHDDAGPGLHLCGRRLQGLRRHTMPPLVPADLIDIQRLRSMDDLALARLGPLPVPMVYRAGDRGFSQVDWDSILDQIAARFAAASPDRLGVLFHPAQQTVETCFTVVQAVEKLAIGRVGLCRPPNHAAASEILRRILGTSATTCSLSDIAKADLVLIIGADPSRRQPDLMRLLARAKRAGTRVVVIDPIRPTGLESAWTLDSPRSATWGSRIMDDLVQIRPDGDHALLTALLRVLIDRQAIDQDFIDGRSQGFEALKQAVQPLDLHDLQARSGVSPTRVAWVAELLARSQSCVTVFGPGLVSGPSGPQALATLAHIHLAMGMLGRVGTGLFSLVQGEGTQAALDLGLGGHVDDVLALAQDAPLDTLWAIGDDLLSGLAQPDPLLAALGQVGTRVHQVGVLSRSHLVEPQREIILLPAQTRYQQAGGAVVTSVERRLRFSPPIDGLPPTEARPGWWIVGQIIRRLRPDLRAELDYADAQAVRQAIDRTVPRYTGIAALRTAGDHMQWGGPQLYKVGFFDQADGLAHFDLPAV